MERDSIQSGITYRDKIRDYRIMWPGWVPRGSLETENGARRRFRKKLKHVRVVDCATTPRIGLVRGTRYKQKATCVLHERVMTRVAATRCISRVGTAGARSRRVLAGRTRRSLIRDLKVVL